MFLCCRAEGVHTEGELHVSEAVVEVKEKGKEVPHLPTFTDYQASPPSFDSEASLESDIANKTGVRRNGFKPRISVSTACTMDPGVAESASFAGAVAEAKDAEEPEQAGKSAPTSPISMASVAVPEAESEPADDDDKDDQPYVTLTFRRRDAW
eukprot:s2247_g5.t1